MISNRLMHGVDFTGTPTFPVIVSEKLEGVRCVYVPGDGFYTREGKKWSVLGHIVVPPTVAEPIDGELYAPDMTFQAIAGAAQVNQRAPSENTLKLQFYAFDIISPRAALSRKQRLLDMTGRGENFVPHTFALCDTLDKYRRVEETLRASNAEGMMLLSPRGGYRPGKHGDLLRVKFYNSETYRVSHVEEGEGKAAGHVGVIYGKAGRRIFGVGTMLFPYEDRRRLLHEMRVGNWMMRVKYVSLSEDGVPQNASVQAVWRI